jgi:predicted Zn-dependent protease
MKSTETKKQTVKRRDFLRYLGLVALVSAKPALAFNLKDLNTNDLVDIIDPEKKNKDLQKAKKVVGGAGKMVAGATGLDYEDEFTIGETLALEGFKRYGLPLKSKDMQYYVNMLANAVAKNSVRPTIPYYAVVVKSDLMNAFACPGGILFVSSALAAGCRDESELACIMAHEVSHAAHKHALQSIQRAKFFEGIADISEATMKGDKGKDFRKMIGTLQTTLFDKGLDQNMEFEADLSGMETAYRTGYDPGGFIRVLEMLQSREAGAVKQGSWFSTHPPLSIRISRCREQMRRYPDAASLARLKQRFVSFKSKM